MRVAGLILAALLSVTAMNCQAGDAEAFLSGLSGVLEDVAIDAGTKAVRQEAQAELNDTPTGLGNPVPGEGPRGNLYGTISNAATAQCNDPQVLELVNKGFGITVDTSRIKQESSEYKTVHFECSTIYESRKGSQAIFWNILKDGRVIRPTFSEGP